MKTIKNKHKMRKAEQKELFDKISQYISRKLVDMKSEGWLNSEIAELADVVDARITEFRMYDTYRKPMSFTYIKKFLAGGIISTRELMENIELNDEEKECLIKLQIFENPELPELFAKLKARGKDPFKILKEALKELS